jgi:hypothetical protein
MGRLRPLWRSGHDRPGQELVDPLRRMILQVLVLAVSWMFVRASPRTVEFFF